MNSRSGSCRRNREINERRAKKAGSRKGEFAGDERSGNQ